MQHSRSGIAALVALIVVASGGVLVLSAPAAAASSCSFPVSTVDATGTTVTVDSEPAEVVTLAPSAAQTMWEVGAKDKVVGVSHNADYLSGTSSRTTISSFSGGIDTETVVKLDPDLVLAPNVVEDATVEQLRSTGLTVYKFEAANTIEDVYAKTRLTGRLVGACSGADGTVADMKEKVETARQAVEGKERPPVFYHMGGGWTAGSDTFIHEIITTAGGENVAASAGISFYQVMSPEVVVAEDPEWFIRGSVPVPNSAPYSRTTAGRRGQIVVVNPDYINQPAPRIVHPIEAIAEALHPDVDIDLSRDSGVTADLTRTTPEYEPARSAGGDLTVAVSGLYENRSASIEFPDGEGPNAESGVDVRAVDLTLAEPNPTFEVTVSETAGGPTATTSGERVRIVEQFAVTGNGLWPDEVAGATVRLTVDEEALADADVTLEEATLYRSEDDAWTPVETTVVRRGDGTVEVTASAATIGTFALGAAAAGIGSGDSAAEPGGTTTAEGHSPSPEPTVTEPGDRPTVTSTTGDTPTSEAPGQPGFGTIGALVALGGGVALRTWWGHR